MTMNHAESFSSVDPEEIQRFQQTSSLWWDEQGPYRLLYAMNPIRLGWLVENLREFFDRRHNTRYPLEGLRILDIGCGGGLLSEPLARLGGTVTGVDATADNCAVASDHARQQGVRIEYLNTTAEALAEEGRTFDAVVALEILEHVRQPEAFVATCRRLMATPGLLAMSTLNRTLLSYGLAIVAAERLLGWVPQGTHTWRRFVRPRELTSMMRQQGLAVGECEGFHYSAVRGVWSRGGAKAINYGLTAYLHKNGIQQRLGENSSSG